MSYLQEKLKQVIKNPRSLGPSLTRFIRRTLVKKVTVNGEKFYQYQGELYPEYLNNGNAASFILPKAKPYCQGKGLDIGASKWPFPGATPIDNAPGQNAYQLDTIADSSLDYVFSSHCLEHLENWKEALKLWIGKLKPGGILFLYLPHESMKLWHPGAPWVSDGHKWIPTHQVLNKFLSGERLEIIDYNPQTDKYWSFHIVARKL